MTDIINHYTFLKKIRYHNFVIQEYIKYVLYENIKVQKCNDYKITLDKQKKGICTYWDIKNRKKAKLTDIIYMCECNWKVNTIKKCQKILNNHISKIKWMLVKVLLYHWRHGSRHVELRQCISIYQISSYLYSF